MTKSLLQKLTLLAMIVLLIATPVMIARSETESRSAYDIPRMLGLESNGEAGEGEMIRREGAPTTGIEGPFFETLTEPVVMDKDLRDLPQAGPDKKEPMREMGKFDGKSTASGPDPVVQNTNNAAGQPIGPLAVAPAPLMNFKGLDFNHWGGGWPPDTHGDVGPTYYIQVVNTSIGIFNKTSGSRVSAFTFDSFFSGTGTPCDADNYGDPIALYDEISGRWIITDFAWSNIQNGPYYECIGVSQTADPVSGGWYLYGFRADDDSHRWLNDYPKLGAWSDGIYMSANLFDCIDSNCNSATYDGVRVWALNREDMISGSPLSSVSFILGTSYYSLLPSNLKGDLPPSGAPAYFVSDDYDHYGSKLNLWKFHVNWGTPGSSTLTGPQSFSIAPFSEPSSNVSQLGSPEKLDTLGDRLMTWLQYRNIGGTESLWVSRTVDTGPSLGIRWTEIRNMSTTPSVYQQGTYAPDSNDRWMPSLAVNGYGDMAVGYSVSSSSMYPSIRYAGRLAGDTLGQITQTETALIAGTGSQNGGYNRWGDYSSMAVDPSDDCTFWYTTEYYETTGSNWQTRIGSFQLSGCTSTLPTIHVGDLDGTSKVRSRSSTWRAFVTITVHDANHAPMRRVTVSVTWSGGYTYSASCRTNSRGQCKVRTPWVSLAMPSTTLNVTNLILSGYVYDPAQNHDPDGDSDGTSITIIPVTP